MTIDENSIPKSRKSYLIKMAAKMAVQQGKKYLDRNPESRFSVLLEQADTLVNHVGRLKGAAMKAVQSLSIEGSDFLPPEVLDILEKLQSQAPPVDSEILLNQIRSELGERNFSQLKNLTSKPIASASIGQVYEAQYKDIPVVIKVQYPGIAESVDADIDTLKTLLKGLLVLNRKKIDFDDVLEEARRVLKLETDYRQEEKSLLLYKKRFQGSDYTIPDVFPELTTSKVLVMSKESGLEYSQWLKTNPSPEQKQKVADLLLKLFIKEFFENRLVQTDPNPANFLITEQGKMVLLDFGATLEFEQSFVKDYQIMVRKVFSKDRQQILDQVFQLKFLDPREEEEVQQVFVNFLLLSMLPFDPTRQPFDFSSAEYGQTVRAEAFKFSRQLKYSAPPKDLIFLNRKLGGIFMLLRKLNMKADLTEFRQQILNHDYF